MSVHARHLFAVDSETGEVKPLTGCPDCANHLSTVADLETLVEQLTAEKRGQSLQIGNLKRELRDLRAADPEQADIRGVLAHARATWGKRWAIAPGEKRWNRVRARFHDRPDNRDPFTVDELKLVAEVAAEDPWLNGTDAQSPGYLKVETVYRDFEQVERLLNQALCDCGCRRDQHELEADEVGWFRCEVCDCGNFTRVQRTIAWELWRRDRVAS